jgi:hypothetical protein
MANGLTTRQQKFVELIRDGKAPKDAAEGAGFAPGSALVQSQRLLKNPLVQAAMAETSGQAKEPGSNGYDAEETLQRLDDLTALCTRAFTLAAEIREKVGALLDRNASMTGGSFTLNIIGLAAPGPGLPDRAAAADPIVQPTPAPGATS